MIDRRPALIARCNDVDDGIAAVSLAVAQDLPIAIRGGGHNVAGHAVCDEGVMIDLSLMRGVTVDAEARVAVVEGGALWRDVDKASQAPGLSTPGGLMLHGRTSCWERWVHAREDTVVGGPLKKKKHK